MTSVVPQSDDRLGPVMFIAQRTQARRAQQEEPAGRRFEPEPAGGEHSQEMTARKEQRVPFYGTHPPDNAIGSRPHLVR